MVNDAELDSELWAMQIITSALSELEPAAKTRVLAYVTARLGFEPEHLSNGRPESEIAKSVEGRSYSELAELYDAVSPSNEAEKALVAAYWSQVCNGAESFESLTLNKGLKDLGQGVSNITSALSKLMDAKPSLVLQIKKSGKSQQARKLYKITEAGKKFIRDMLNENS
jgi:hypothetical protein